MKICFIEKKWMEKGSYRIHVNDLNIYFNKIGIFSAINPTNVEDFDVIIYGKSTSVQRKKNKIIGVITPSSDNYRLIKEVDFLIVGSVEEKESMIQYNRNCFIFPQIENMYLNEIPKKHIKKEEIIIGYHGNQNHLNHMNLGLKTALERLSKEYKIKLIVTAQNQNEWIQGKPNVPYEFRKWSMKSIKDTINEFDIGIVPNISDIECQNKLNHNITLGMYNTDIKIRFKNKSNIGRALVLFQMGIPVISDLTPSCMHILANPDNGYAVLGEDGWYNALKDLCCETTRNFVSQNAYSEYKRLYDPLKWAKRISSDIEKLFIQ
tara:strand:- start:2791 stop:3753 length:963 start_codon:yes stop_codon:yes gene_type:complete